MLKLKYESYKYLTEKLQSTALLFVRLVLAYGFYNPAMMKVKNMNSIIEWFGSIGIPFPLVNAYLATATELLGVLLLTIGFGVRIISIPLIVTMVVAIITVHWNGGFDAGNNGFEIPLYYMLMLFILLTHGAGKYSLDYLLRKK
ncbi:MAG: HvfX family Cu-binding RiPP maturation protein [Cytophaga sp.]|uniref:HvfX family Cu-binding RiPP maturation protein n=1 Tax=Cytophaga sp. TaxID=29535 RepID=UPI003F82105C